MLSERELDRARLELLLCQEVSQHTHVAQVFVSKQSGHVQFSNRKAGQLWPHLVANNEQTSVEQIIESHAWASDDEKQAVLGRYRKLSAHSEPFEVECACTGKHEADTYHRMTFVPCQHPVTGEDAVTISEYDVSDLKRVEAELVEELRTQELTFNSISHELRAPLNGIVGLTDSALNSHDVPAHLRKSLKVIKATGQRMAGLVDDLLDAVSTRQSKLIIKHEMCDLFNITQDVVEIMAPLARRNVEIQNRVPRSLPRVEGDSRRISQILTNLLSNACKFTSKGCIAVEAEQVGDSVQLRVVDSGLGIPADKLESIFGAFQQVDERTTRTYGGTGLGLTLVRSLVEAHNGQISVASTFGAGGATGTAFSIRLPLLQPAEPKHAELSQPLSTGSSATTEPAASPPPQPQPAATAALEGQTRALQAQVQELRASLRRSEDELAACKLRLAAAAADPLPADPPPPSFRRQASAPLRCSAPPPHGQQLAQLDLAVQRAGHLAAPYGSALPGHSGSGAGRVSAASVASQVRAPSGSSCSRTASAASNRSASSAASTVGGGGGLQDVLVQHLLEREELLERKLLVSLHAQQRAEMQALRAEHTRRSALADSILHSIDTGRIMG